MNTLHVARRPTPVPGSSTLPSSRTETLSPEQTLRLPSPRSAPGILVPLPVFVNATSQAPLGVHGMSVSPRFPHGDRTPNVAVSAGQGGVTRVDPVRIGSTLPRPLPHVRTWPGGGWPQLQEVLPQSPLCLAPYPRTSSLQTAGNELPLSGLPGRGLFSQRPQWADTLLQANPPVPALP